MARDAIGKLAEADTIHKMAVKIKARDPSGSAALESLAAAKVRSAVKQLRTKPKRKVGATRVSPGFAGPVLVPTPTNETK